MLGGIAVIKQSHSRSIHLKSGTESESLEKWEKLEGGKSPTIFPGPPPSIFGSEKMEPLGEYIKKELI